MLLNNKTYMEWSLEDIEIIVNDENYRENESIDYKINFSYLECTDKKQQNQKKNEFKNDICSFANANGGYLIFGLAEAKGIPTKIIGVEVASDNTDKFELDIRNIINQISPVAPVCKIKFVKIEEEKYIIVIRIEKGYHLPYVSRYDESYKFYIRKGNGKVPMTYDEVRTMFNQSLLLSEQIENFRCKRVELCNNKEGIASFMKSDSFSLVHIIPEFAFTNPFFFNPYDEWESRRIKFSFIFTNNSFGVMVPNVDGIAYKAYENKRYIQIFKSGIVEKYIPINPREVEGNSGMFSIPVVSIYEQIISIFEETIRLYIELDISAPIYIVSSIKNCKGCRTENNFYNDYQGFVDREEVCCMPIVIQNIHDSEEVEKAKQLIKNELFTSLGRRDMDI